MYYIIKGEPTPIQYLKGVGPTRAKGFNKSGIYFDVDLLFYFPKNYISRTSLLTLKQIQGMLLKDNYLLQDNEESLLKQEVTLLCKATKKELKTSRGRKKFLVVEINDLNGDTAKLFFWQYADYYDKLLEKGQYFIIYGMPEYNPYNGIVFHHPEVERLDKFDEVELQRGETLPIYSINSYLKSSRINNKILRKILRDAIPSILPKIDDFLPSEVLAKNNLPDIKFALKNIHFPEDIAQVAIIKKKFKFEEAFLFETLLAHYRRTNQERLSAPKFKIKNNILREFKDSLPFELTNDQKKVISEIFSDLQSGKPMNRLLQGDVGSGKTIVAVFAMLLAKVNGHQSAIMAPTEILAEQHYLSLTNLLANFPIQIEIVVGSQTSKEREKIANKVLNGEIDILVGTHALFEGNLQFCKLGLVIIDEQHRFGVAQRNRLRELAKASLSEKKVPHILVMSATPIPRTLAMTLYGDLDVSIIRELPKGRKPVITKIVSEANLPKMYDFIRDQLKKGFQAYFVYPLIEKSDKIEVKSATEHWELLQKKIFPEFSCGLLHGKMKSLEKENVMKDFKEKKYNILVATTVIEVGIDVPNANIIVIENAERFGLSQLHQLRGRVGRGSTKSFCFLVTEHRFDYQENTTLFSDFEQKTAYSRLKAMEQTTDGFLIAEIDLKLRGPGDILGIQQSGLPPFKYVNIATDGDIISSAKEFAYEIIEADPYFQKNPKLKSVLGKMIQYKKYFGIG